MSSRRKRLRTRQELLEDSRFQEVPRKIIQRDRYLDITEDKSLPRWERLYYELLAEELGRKRKSIFPRRWKIGRKD